MDATILIVDDSPFIVDGLAAILTRKGYTPLSANGGDDCLSVLKTVTPDLILLDIMMEPMDGWETLEKIRENPVTKDIPVLMFSAKKITPDEAREHSMNIDDFVSKPVSPAQLLESIQRIFSRRNDVLLARLAAQDKGMDTTIIDEYALLRKNVEVNRNLLSVLRAASGIDLPGREVSREDRDAIRNLEDKVYAEERRLREIHDLVEKVQPPVLETKKPEGL
ncbi:response regulator receiver protein [Methanoregula boonei 6A8]|jgi:CheY-like chemotaxis protein|uniref:Response regulator receiver protein n=1 Tax=Methanoregula boonei (strain DSM 21154 / JCM 14090 / 6A8) TaxID=456442 RepID=A7I9P0_METB6|nr:response regulator [Methanoregula boonei]ABS56451.1 response regulator receiver protein [Methanoregula boonei 6A8]